MGGKYIDLLLKFPKTFACLLVIVTGLSGYLFSRLPIETSVESLIMEDDPDLVFYETFKQAFGEDEFIIIAFSSDDIFTPQMLGEINEVTRKLEGIKEIKEVVSITNVESILGTDHDFYVQPLCEDIPGSMEAAGEIKKRAFSLNSVKNNIISNDGKASLFLVRTLAHEGDETYDARLLKNIEQVFKDHASEGAMLRPDTIHLAGWLVTDVNMSSHINRDNQIFMPLIYAILGFFLFLTLRSPFGVAIGLVNVTLCLLWTMAALFLAGGAISPMTAILSPLMMALSVSDSIHVLLHFFQKKRTRDTLIKTLRGVVDELWRPCFLTSLTTAIGFLSLIVSDIPPIRHFGLASAMGMMAEFFLTMTLLPLMIYFFRNTKAVVKDYKIQNNYLSRLSGKISLFILKNKRIILCISAVCVVGSIFGFMRIRVETNLIEYFKKDSAIYQDFKFIDTRLNGVDTLEISIKSKNNESLMTPGVLKQIQAVESYLASLPIVGTTTSVNSFIKQMNKSFHAENPDFYSIPDSGEMIAQYMLIYGGNEIFNFLNDDYTWTRISARISEHSSKEVARYLRDIRSFTEKNIDISNIEVRVTGKTFLVNKLLKSIVDSQVESLLLAFVIIFGILFLVFRSFKLGCISVVPNALPILFNLGLMGFMGIPLNTATAIISAVAIGIAVDDTIHYLTIYQLYRSQGMPRREAALESVKTKGEPIMVTSFILCFGFGVMVFSSFVPTIQFGFLSAEIMFVAMVCDLFILPALLLVKEHRNVM